MLGTLGSAAKPALALKPILLDAAFEKPADEKALKESLAKDKQYQKAVKAAIAAKTDREKAMADGLKIGPSPAQAGRVKFLEVLAEDEFGKSDEK